MWLEPIAEGTPEHAGGGARRTPFHHIVLSVEEICRVTWIECPRRESGQRRKHRARPFPAVAHQVMNSKCACTVGICSAWRGIKMSKIEIAKLRPRRFFAPRIAALLIAMRHPVGGAMELLFARQLSIQPFRIRGRFGMAHVHRRVH